MYYCTNLFMVFQTPYLSRPFTIRWMVVIAIWEKGRKPVRHGGLSVVSVFRINIRDSMACRVTTVSTTFAEYVERAYVCY